VAEFSTPTSTGTLAITETNMLNGLTPKAAIVVLTLNPTWGAYAQGSTHVSVGFGANDGNMANTRSYRHYSTSSNDRQETNIDRVIGMGSGATAGVIADIASWDADGITLDFSAVTATSYKGFVILFAGDDLEAEVITSDLGATSATGLSREPDVMFVNSQHINSYPTSSTGFASRGFGFIHNDKSNPGTLTYGNTSVLSTNSSSRGHTSNVSGFHTDIELDGEADAFKHYTISNLTDSGFDIDTTGTGTRGYSFGFLALTWHNGVNVKILNDLPTTPTGTGNVSTTGIGFEPSWGLWQFSWSGTSATDKDAHTSFNLLTTGDPATGEFSMTECNQDGSSLTLGSGTFMDNTQQAGRIWTGNPYFQRTLTSWDSDGFTFNYSQEMTGSRSMPAILIGFPYLMESPGSPEDEALLSPGSPEGPESPADGDPALLLESGDYILLENGDKILLE
jgi:hypothetical protein